MNAIEFEQYYTKPDVAQQCWEHFQHCLPEDTFIVEPCAGAGAMLNAIQGFDKIGFDIDPKAAGIIKFDTLIGDFRPHLPPGRPIAVFSNTPFGTRNNKAIPFLNKLLSIADYVGVIVPCGMNKAAAQIKVDQRASLILSMALREDAFTHEDKCFNLKTAFHVWTTKNLRLIDKGAIAHADFEIYQDNGSEPSRRYSDWDWDMAVPRNGSRSDENIVFAKVDAHPEKQYLFFRVIAADKQRVIDLLKKIDWPNICSRSSTTVKTVGKADVVRAYQREVEREPKGFGGGVPDVTTRVRFGEHEICRYRPINERFLPMHERLDWAA